MTTEEFKKLALLKNNFYKIGRTFLKTERRFRSNKLPYKYKVLQEFVDDDGKFIRCDQGDPVHLAL